MAHFIYILRCADGTLYVGSTNDLGRRVREHKESKRGARYTRGRRPVALVHSEKFRKLGAALRREYEIKSWRRERKLALVKDTSWYDIDTTKV